MNQNLGGAFNPSDSQNGTKSKAPGGFDASRTNRCVPLMINWILEAHAQVTSPDCEFLTIDNEEIAQMSVVGRIVETDNQPGKTLITIDDTTGSSLVIQVNKRYDQNEPRILQNVNLDANQYIKVIVNLSKYKEELVFMGIHLQTIEQGDAVTEHNLRSILCQKHRKYGPIRDEETENMAPNANANTGANGNAKGNQQMKPGFDANATLENQVITLLRNQNSAMNLDMICKGLQNQDRGLVATKLETLINDGEIFEEDNGMYQVS